MSNPVLVVVPRLEQRGPAELEEARRRVQEYADAIRAGDKVLDQAALDRAEDLALLYESKAWVAEVEPPKNTVYRGRPVDPESRNRFIGWALTTFGLGARYGKYLLQAHDWRSTYGHSVPISRLTEGAIRPAYALERKGYGDRTPEVMAHAAELAAGGQITQAHVKQAVSEFWATIPKGEVRRRNKDAEARRHATIARRELMWLAENGYMRDLAEVLTEMDAVGARLAES